MCSGLHMASIRRTAHQRNMQNSDNGRKKLKKNN